MTKIRVLVLSVLVLLCVAVGFLFFAEYTEFSSRGEVNTPESVASQEKERAVEEIQEPVTYFLGTVKAVSGNTVVLEVEYPVFEDAEANLRKRTVIIGENTIITRTERRDAETEKKDAEAFDRAVAEYEKALAKTGEGEVPPTPPVPAFPATVEVVSTAMLEVGESVSVMTTEDVRSLESFTADSVEIIPQE